ncbi:hypothetical protein PIB30_045373 [Stylosanthes scabra]|uniref:Uncharacterized protein n=1 Tax=Stylosanthes scabra TaxID=79078 RepID=A0ABU6TGY0_9FABA|nr:hypothetical protein [Stylosanthes scabra]
MSRFLKYLKTSIMSSGDERVRREASMDAKHVVTDVGGCDVKQALHAILGGSGVKLVSGNNGDLHELNSKEGALNDSVDFIKAQIQEWIGSGTCPDQRTLDLILAVVKRREQITAILI